MRTPNRSLGIVEDDPQRVAPAGAQPADAVAQVAAVAVSGACDRALVNGEAVPETADVRSRRGGRL